MFKKCLAALLALAVMMSVLPVQLTAQAVQPTAAVTEEMLRPLVEQQVKAYARSIAQKNAGDEAVEQLARHAMFKNGKQLNAGEGAALTAALMNAQVAQRSLAEGLTSAVVLMQSTDTPRLYLHGYNGWYDFMSSYGLAAYSEQQELTAVEHDDDRAVTEGLPVLDTNKRIAQASYGEVTADGLNTNDEALMLVVGSSAMRVDVTRVRVGETTAVYKVRVQFADRFDFNASYEAGQQKGYDTSAAEVLTAFGVLLGGVMLDPFQWVATAEFELELPYACTHATASYRWSYDAASRQLIAQTGEGIVRNPASAEGQPEDTAQYYRLQTPVRLLHTRPWVVEYQAREPRNLMFAAVSEASNFYPYLYQYGANDISVRDAEVLFLTPDQMQQYDTPDQYHTLYRFWGVKTAGRYAYSSGTVYTYRLENRIAPDGGNMVYLSVYDNDLQQTVLPPTAMTQYWWGDVHHADANEEAQPSDAVSGLDFYVNYLGNANNQLNPGSLTLTIWENGEGNEPESCFVTTYKAPTCTEPGGNVHTCTRCGYSEFLTVEPALGHSYGEYVSDDNAQCEQDATKTAACTVCKKTKTVTEPGTALEHQWKEATCDTLKHCTLCYKTVGSALGHSIEVIPEQPPTCTKMGFTAGEWCPVCGKMVTARKVVKATGHSDNNGDDRCDSCAVWLGEGSEPAPAPSYTPGDVNGDEEVNNKDATRLFQYLSGWDVEVVAAVLDVNGDGEVNNKDATRLFQYLSGWAVTIR